MEILRHFLSHSTYYFRKFNIQTLPRKHMLPEFESRLLVQLYSNANQVLELGSGGSTLYCDDHNIACTSFETDFEFYSLLKEKLTEGTTVELNYINIGITASYSAPLLWRFRNVATLGDNYIGTVEKALDKKPHDLIFIDGRWRIACALLVLSSKKSKDSTVIIDDVFSGKYYEQHVKRLFEYSPKGRLAILHSIKSEINISKEIKYFVRIAD